MMSALVDGSRALMSGIGDRCLASMSGVGWSMSGVDVGRRFSRRKSAPGKCFRFCLAVQDSGLHYTPHSLETVIATGNKSLLIYDFGRKRGRREAQAPIEKGGGAISSVDRFCLVQTAFPWRSRRSQSVRK